MSKSKFEKFNGKNGFNIFSNAKSLFGEEGEKLVNDIMSAVEKAVDTTKEELAKRSPKVTETAKVKKGKITEALNNLDVTKYDSLSDFFGEMNNVIKDIFSDSSEDKKQKCDCNKDKACSCKCHNDTQDKDDAEQCTCNADEPVVLGNDIDYPFNESASTHFVRTKHQAYLNSLYDIIKVPVSSPLPRALHHLYHQAYKSYNNKKKYDTINISNVEKQFLTDIINTLFAALDFNFNVLQEEDNDNLPKDYEYDEYELPVFVDGNEDNEDINNFIPTKFEEDLDFWFNGITDIAMPSISIRVYFDKYSTEIKQRLCNNTDDNHLIWLIAQYTNFRHDNIEFIYHNDSEGELRFSLEDDLGEYNER